MVEVLLSILDDDIEVLKPTSNPATAQNVASTAAVATAGVAAGNPVKAVKLDTLSPVDKIVAFVSGVIKGLLGPVLPGDTPNCLKLSDCRNPGTVKACAFGEYVSLDKVKALRRFLPGTTVNDILAAVLNMCICRYFEERGDPILHTKGAKVRANFPINMRAKGESAKNSLGNRFSSGAFSFNLHYHSRVGLVWEVKRQIDLIKASPQPLVENYMLQSLLPLLSDDKLYDAVLDTFGNFTMMMSNVQGPQSTAYFNGQPIVDLTFLAFSPIGAYAGLLSYDGKVSLTVSTVATREKRPQDITKHWKTEFDALYNEAAAAVAAAESGKLKPPSFASNWTALLAICGGAAAVVASSAVIMGAVVRFAVKA